MSTATLGVAIESSGAKKGAEEVNTAQNSMGTTAQKVSTQMQAATAAVTRKVEEQAAAYRVLTGVLDKKTGTVYENIQAMQKAEREANRAANEARRRAAADMLSAQASRESAAATKAVEEATKAINPVTTAATEGLKLFAGSMAARTAATSAGTVATRLFTGAVGAMGGPLGVVMTILTVMPMVLDKVREAKEKAKKQAEDYTKALKDMSPAAREAAISLEQQFQAQLRTERRFSTGDRKERDELIEQSNARIKALQMVQGEQQRVDALARSESLGKLARDIGDALEVNERFRTGGERSVEAFQKAASAWYSSGDATRSFARALNEGDTEAMKLMSSAERLTGATGTLKDMQEAAKKAAEAHSEALKAQEKEAKRVAEVLADIFDTKKKYAQQIAELGKKEDAHARKEIDQLIERRDKARETAREILDAQGREMEAVGMTRDAYLKLRAEMDLSAVVKQLQEMGIAGPDLAGFITAWKEQRGAIDSNTAAVEAFLEATARIGSTATGWSQVADAVGGLVGQFGGLNAGIAEAIRGSADLAANISQAQRTGIYQKKDAEGKLQTFNVGFGGALRGEAGAAGQFAAATSAIGIMTASVSILKGIMDAVDLFGDQARERERVIKERARAFNAALDEYTITQRTGLESALRQNLSGANQVATQLGVSGASFSSPADINAGADYYLGMSKVGRKDQQAEYRMMSEALRKLSAEMQANEKIIRERAAAEEAMAMRDLDVRRLRALGLNTEADAAQNALEADRALAAARDKYGKDSAYVTALASVIATEQDAAKAIKEKADAEAALTRLRQGTDFATDLAARQQRRAGNEGAAFGIEQAASGGRAIRDAEDLYKAGAITLEMLEQFKIVVGEEMTDAMKRFNDQAAEAKRRVDEDLSVRALVAQGMSAQAEAERIAIANRRELADVTDAATKAAIEHVHQLEAEARERARIADIEKAHRDIISGTIAALKILNPAKAEELERQQKQIERDKALADAQDDVIRAGLKELFVLQDQADAMLKAQQATEAATKALQEQIEAQIAAANAFRDITASINDEWLRATGRGFEADRIKLGENRDQRLGGVISSGLATLGAMPTVKGPTDFAGMNALTQWLSERDRIMKQIEESVGKVNATYKANLDALIASQFKPTETTSSQSFFTPTTGSPNIPILGEDTTAVRSARSITESSAMRLIDYSAAQLAVQREILAELKGRGGRQTSRLTSPIDGLDRAWGDRVRDSSMLVSGQVQ